MYDSYATGPYVSPCGFARLAAAVRLDAVADLARGVGRAARLERVAVLDREVAPRRLAVDDPLRADHARVADVDHVRAWTFSPMRKPTRKTVAASRTHAGQSGAPASRGP